MADPQLTHLLDRAVQHAPPMDLDGEHLLAAGKSRVRRRRVLGAGGGLATVALVAAVWGGLAGGDGLAGDLQIQPATTVWEQGEAVDAILFTGYQTIDGDQVGHFFDGRLTRPDVAGPVVLELSDHGVVVEQIPAHSPHPGLEVFTGQRMTVAVWAEPDGVVSAVPLVGPVDPGGPSSRTGVELGGERYGYSVWPADVTGFVRPEQVLDVYLLGEDEVVALSGAEVDTVELVTEGTSLLLWADAGRGVWGYAVSDPRSASGPVREPVLWPLGGQPAHTMEDAWHEDDRGVALALLPQDAELVDVGHGEVMATTLAGRPVALSETRGRQAQDVPDVVFRIGEHEHVLAPYTRDLAVVDLADGTQLGVTPDAAGSGGVTLGEPSAASQGVALELSAADLAAGRAVESVGGSLVTVVVGWQPGASVLSDAQVEVTQDGVSRWITPDDVAQVRAADGRLLSVLTVDEEEGVAVTGVGVSSGEDDSILRWDGWEPLLTGADGVEWQEIEGQVVPFVDGEPLEDLGVVSLGEARLFAHPGALGGGVDLLVLPPDLGVDDTVLPLLRKGDSLDPAPWVLGDSRVVETQDGPVLVVETTAGMLTEGAELAVRWASALRDGAANVWAVLGADRSGHVSIDGGLVVTVGGPDVGDPWVFYPQGDDSWGETSTSVAVQAGLVGSALLEIADPTDPHRLHVAAVLPEGTGGELVLAPGARLVTSQTRGGPLEGLEVVTAVVDLDLNLAPTDAVGLDLDGDGVADLRLPMRG